jgi:hypothetical protein
MEAILMQGIVWPLVELDKDLRKQDLQDALTLGNHKGTSVMPESLRKLMAKSSSTATESLSQSGV